jgi:hypothetical protein
MEDNTVVVSISDMVYAGLFEIVRAYKATHPKFQGTIPTGIIWGAELQKYLKDCGYVRNTADILSEMAGLLLTGSF